MEKLPESPQSPEPLTGANLEVTVSPDAHQILDTLMHAYQENLPPYDEAILPQVYKPESLQPGGEHHGTHAHAMYFWHICSYMRGPIKSETAFKKLTKVFNQNPELFDTQYLASADTNSVVSALESPDLPRRLEVAKSWTINAQRLQERYNGNPLNIFKEASSYEECVTLLKNDKKGGGFYGFQEKMTSMLLYYYIDENLISDINFPLPVDFHALRVALATEIITVNPPSFYRYDNTVEDTIRSLIQNYQEDRGTNPRDLTNAIWLLSSNLCNQSPGNTASYQNNELSFPEVNPNTSKYSESWQKTCGRCALNAYCQHFIPSTPYYKKGAIIMRPKIHPTQEQQSLFPEGL